MRMEVLIGVVILIIAGSSFLLVVAVRGKLRPGFGRSWRLQQAVGAVAQCLLAFAFLTLALALSKRHPFGLSGSQLIETGVMGIVPAFICCLFALYVAMLRVYRSSGMDIRLPHWMYRWIFDQSDTYRLGQRTARANGATETGDPS
jgi:Kef-type K+ transport system membrane component KefB